MKMSNKKFITLVILTIVLTIGAWQNAHAWTPMGATWENGWAYYRFASSVPTSFRGHIDFGANVWTKADVSSFVWYKSSWQGVKVIYQNYDGPGGVLGHTFPSADGNAHFDYYTYVLFDKAENWYLGSGVPAYNQIDLRSIAAHEMGHALGLDHTGDIYCPNNTYKATMCNGYKWGSYYLRTLAGDDRNGLKTLYP